jgi:heptose I phosphotransferase
MKIETLDEGRIRAAKDFVPLLRAHGLDTFAGVMAWQGGRIARDFPGRQTFRLELRLPGGGMQAVYLKRYERRYLSGILWLKRRMGWPGAEDEALREWENIQQIRANGIDTATPIAVGQKEDRGVVVRSFLMTAEITGAEEGHTFAERACSADRRRFLQRVAELARRFHEAGFVHKDFYLGHVLVVPGSVEPALFLIDLQRAVRPCCRRKRWIAKDLGALAYSILRAGGSRADWADFYQTYCGREKLDSVDQRLARQILRRVQWLSTRRPRHDGDFDPSL